MSSNTKENLRMLLECLDRKITVDEACSKYDINRYTYYKQRRQLIRTALDFLNRHSENVDAYYHLYQENQLLRKKIIKLQKEKQFWESKYNWIYYHLDVEKSQQDLRKSD